MQNLKFTVTGMTCSACSSHVQSSVSKLDGVSSVNVNLLTKTMDVSCADSVSEREIISAVKNAGYNAFSADKKVSASDETVKMKRRLLSSLAFMIPLFYISMGHMLGLPLPSILSAGDNAFYLALVELVLCIPILVINFKYFKVGFTRLFKLSPNMDSLIAIGSSSAVIYSLYVTYRLLVATINHDTATLTTLHMSLYFESAAMILTLITLGKFLESRSTKKTTAAIEKLLDLSPKTAIVERDGTETEIATQDILKGDIVIIKAGRAIPVDGVIIEGSATIDESAITGESVPVDKSIGDKVIGACINTSGYIKVRAEKVGDDTTLSEIIRLVEEASSSKAPIAKLADKVSLIFVPAVILISIITFVAWMVSGSDFEFALTSAISVLVISCPCALGLATPTAIMVSTGKAAELGILIKSAEALETLHSIDTAVFDKTGTITHGKPAVTDIVPLGDVTEDQLVQIAYSLEKMSEHPISKAICDYAQKTKSSFFEVENFVSSHGKGISATIKGIACYAGNRLFIEENGIETKSFSETAETLALDGKTVIYFADSTKVLGLIAVADTIKDTSKTAISELEKMGIQTVMLTGDNKTTAKSVQRLTGIKQVIAQVLPTEKEAVIRKLKSEGKKVAMIGDGINDSPALASADVGIAIGAGSDIAIESADIVLIKNDLLDVVSAIKLSKSTLTNIKENLFWAFIYNAIGIPFAAGLFIPIFNLQLDPMFAAAAMSMSSVCVVTNALRLKRFKYKPKKEKTKENVKMEKKILIEGMACHHCSGRVEKVLNEMEGVSATVNLEEKTAYVTVANNTSDSELKKAIEDAGYTVVSIK